MDPLEPSLATPYYSNGTPAPANPTDAFYNEGYHETTEEEGVFGQVDYDLTDTFRVTAALRYGWDHRHVENDFREVFDFWGIEGGIPGLAGPLQASFGLPPSLDVTPVGANNPAYARGQWSDWSGKIGAEWRPDRSTMAYAYIARGWLPGGFDVGLTPLLAIPEVKPETLIDYEAGFKKTWGKKLLIDAAVFYYDYSNLQIPVTVPVPQPATPANPAGGFLPESTDANAQKARSYGAELSAVWSPVDNLHLTFVYSYLNARFQKFTPAGVPSAVGATQIEDPATGIYYSNLNGNIIPQSPENKVTVSPQYIVHFPAGDLSLSANYSWNDVVYYNVFTNPFYRAPSYYNLDLRAVFQPNNSHFTFIVYGRNITDRVQYVFKGLGNYTAASATPVTPPLSIYTVAEPRSAGFEVQYRF